MNPDPKTNKSCALGFKRGASKPINPAQGMADLDPDVDAIYRLTQKLGVNFEKDVASVVLPEGVMCPWNSQNTLFEREALWGLLIPVTTTFRVCDIWRSYWVQVGAAGPTCTRSSVLDCHPSLVAGACFSCTPL